MSQVSQMGIFLVLFIFTSFLTVTFFLLWLKERRHAEQAEVVAYGLRSNDESDENTKTNLSAMEATHSEALDRLLQLGEISQDDWGQWIWKKSGKKMGK